MQTTIYIDQDKLQSTFACIANYIWSSKRNAAALNNIFVALEVTTSVSPFEKAHEMLLGRRVIL